MMKVTLTVSSEDYLMLLADEESYYEDSIKILQCLGFTPTQADKFIENGERLELEIVPPSKIQCVQHQDAECIKIPKETIEYNPLASIV